MQCEHFALCHWGKLVLSPPLKPQNKVAAVQRFSLALLWMVVVNCRNSARECEYGSSSSRYLRI